MTAYSFSYVLITSARNEENYIEKTIQSVINQSLLPKIWVIVDDRSTDRTGDIIKKYSNQYGFINLIQNCGDASRNFGSKAKAIQIAYDRIKKNDFDYLGILDADVSFDPHYYEAIIKKFPQNDKLGIAGGRVVDSGDGKFVTHKVSESFSVSGAVQFFRRKCYEDIGGYLSVKSGVDTVAESMARMYGWEVQTFSELKVLHHRPIGSEGQSIFKAKIGLGRQDYFNGNTPLFEIARCVYRLKDRPFIVGSLLILFGYFLPFFRREKVAVPDEMREFLKKEQSGRLKALLRY